MAMAKMAGDADSESGCDDKERVQQAASTCRPKGTPDPKRCNMFSTVSSTIVSLAR